MSNQTIERVLLEGIYTWVDFEEEVFTFYLKENNLIISGTYHHVEEEFCFLTFVGLEVRGDFKDKCLWMQVAEAQPMLKIDFRRRSIQTT